MRAFDIAIDQWRQRYEKLGDDAVGRKGENVAEQGKRIIELIKPVLPEYVQHGMDFGCGWGRMVPTLAKICGHLWVLDIIESWVHRAAEIAINVTGVCVVEPIFQLESASIDLFVDIMSLQSTKDETVHLKFCRELRRLIKKGATVISLSLSSDPLCKRRIELLDITVTDIIKSTTIDQAGDEYSLCVGTKR